jgi:hypothetical protein
MEGNVGSKACAVTKFNPSKRYNPFAVPTHKYPSGVWVKVLTSPPGKPFSALHWSRMYWEKVLLGSTACARSTKQTAMSVTSKQHRRRFSLVDASWEELKLVNDNLGIAF